MKHIPCTPEVRIELDGSTQLSFPVSGILDPVADSGTSEG